VNELVRRRVAGQLDGISLTFRAGNIHVAGHKKMGIIPLPFAADVRAIDVEGRTIVVPVSIPAIVAPVIRGIAASKIPEGVTIRPPFTFIIQLDRFLPPFVSADIQKIWIIDGGLAVTLGRGGADLPTANLPTGGTDVGTGNGSQ